ncbi:MAG TPA: DegT/DnrJ/EryC1/StrS family aminotransferase [bacterium]|nr:DegT/DnrJ/EryC1/StrS family aminotransferase [bacterium]
MAVHFFDLCAQTVSIRADLDRAFSRVLARGRFILGTEVEQFEKRWAERCGAAHGVGLASATDALFLSFKALEIGPGDEVIVPVLTAPPTMVAVRMTGAIPVLADVESQHLLLSPDSFRAAITARTRAVVPVHLYGCPADMDHIMAIAADHGLHVIEDAAQAHGARWRGKPAGSFGTAAAFSFYPTKNLGAFGDAGMVVTSDPEIARRLRQMRDYGRIDKDTVEGFGVNSRLDELQAAILLAKLEHLDDWNRKRRGHAERYRANLAGLPLSCPSDPEGAINIYHQFVVRTPERDRLREHLSLRSIGTMIHYPRLLCDQPGHGPGGSFPAARAAAGEILSLPIYPELAESEIDEVSEAVADFFRGRSGGT